MCEAMKNPKKWTDLFTRLEDSSSGQPRFSLRGVRSHLLGFHGYRKGDFKPLDEIIELLESETITPTIEESGNVRDPFGPTGGIMCLKMGALNLPGNYSGYEPPRRVRKRFWRPALAPYKTP